MSATDQRRGEDSRQTAELYQALLDASPDPIVVYGEAGLAAYINPAFTDVFGWTYDEIRGKEIDYDPPENRFETRQMLAEILAGRNLVNHESTRCSKDGRVIDVSINGAALSDKERRTAGSVIFLKDITEQKSAQVELRKAHDELERRVAQRTSEPAVSNEALKREMTERQTAEAELRNSQRTLTNILSALPVGTAMAQNRRITWANRTFAEMFGFADEQDCIGRSTAVIYASEDDFDRMGLFSDAELKEGRAAEADAMLKRQDGSTFMGHLSLRALDTPDPTRNIIAVISDVSERERANEALRESEQRYRLLVDHAPVGIAVHVDGTVVFVNRAGAEMLGAAPEYFVGKPVLDNVHPSMREKAAVAVKKMLEKGYVAPLIEQQWVKVDGTVVHTQVAAAPIVYGGKLGIQAVFTDRTELKEAEKALQREKQRFQTLTENAPLGIVMVSSDGTIPYVNSRFTELLGYDLSEIPDGQSWFKLAFPEDGSRREASVAWADFVRNSAGGAGRGYVFVVTCKDRTEKIVRFTPVMLSAGDYMVACEDITELKKAERVLETEAVQRGKIQMAGSVLHDIGNAVTGLGVTISKLIGDVNWFEIPELEKLERMVSLKGEAFAQALGPGKEKALANFAAALQKSLKDRRERFQNQHQTMARTVSHIREILDLQRRYARDGGAGERGVLSLRELIEDALAIHSAGFQKRGVAVKIGRPAHPVRVSGDRTKLIQVFLNIFKNACEAFDAKEEDEAERVLDIAIESMEDRSIRVTVRDNAVGFDPELTDRLFEDGFSTKNRDSGLGLFQCRAIIQGHGGTLRLESRGPGLGAQAIMELPTGKEDLDE